MTTTTSKEHASSFPDRRAGAEILSCLDYEIKHKTRFPFRVEERRGEENNIPIERDDETFLRRGSSKQLHVVGPSPFTYYFTHPPPPPPPSRFLSCSRCTHARADDPRDQQQAADVSFPPPESSCLVYTRTSCRWIILLRSCSRKQKAAASLHATGYHSVSQPFFFFQVRLFFRNNVKFEILSRNFT